MKCPACAAEVAAEATGVPSVGARARAVLLDWRTWALAVGLQLVAGILAGALGTNASTASAGAGGALGLWIALRLGGLRRCPACGRAVRFAARPSGEEA